MKKLLLITTLLLLSTTVFADYGDRNDRHDRNDRYDRDNKTQQLERIASRIVNKADQLEDDTRNWNRREVKATLQELKNLIQRYEDNIPAVRPPRPRPSNFRASCKLDVGGNFFRPESKMECTIYGLGAVAYEVAVNGRVEWRGELEHNNPRNEFYTDKEKVGGHAVTYETFIITERGRRVLVDTKSSRY